MRYPVEGAMHRKLKELVTKENVQMLGFVDWEKTSGLVSKATEGGDPLTFTAAITVAQYIVLSMRFGVKTAYTPVVAHSYSA
jgi:asparagine synthase (glutamine-hydrolysing)